MLLTDIVTLEGAHVRLEPLSLDHIDETAAAAAEITEDLWYTAVPKADEVAANIAWRLAQRDSGTMNPFAVRSLASGAIVGATTLCDINVEFPRTELGYTWFAPGVRGTAVNPESKRLLLAHAFEACGVIAVEFKTNFHNRRSRAAIEKLGAKQDGILRNHRITPDGVLRDTVVYSILPHEWPAVRTGLDARIAAFA